MHADDPPAQPAAAGRWGRLGRWRPSIGAVMALGFGGLIAIAVGGVLAIALDAAQRNTYDLLRSAADSGMDRLVVGLSSHLDPPRHAVERLAQMIADGEVDPADEPRLSDVLAGALSAAPQIAGIAFIRDDLQAVAASQGGGRVTTTAESWIDRPEIRLAIRRGAVQQSLEWDDPFFLETLRSTAITLRMPVKRGDAYLGIVAAAVSVAGISDMLDRLPARFDGKPFVLFGRDHVLAHPALAGGARGASAEKPLPTLAEVGDAVLPAIWSPQVDELTDEIFSGDVTGRNVVAAGEEYVFLYRELKGFGQTPWLVGAYLRLATAGTPIERLILAAAVGIGILLVAVVLALLLGRAIGRPIRRLAEGAEAIGHFELATVPALDRSVLREVDAAARAYNAMLVALRWFETYVPRALVLILLRRSSAGPLRPEEREVTVMFTDIVGFTPISRRLRPMQLARFLTRHFTLVGRCIEAEGGTLDKYMGDSVMAFWNAPEAQGDHAARAARAALAIGQALRADNERRQRKGINPVRLRIGLHSGLALVGNTGAPGRINYTLIGETVNICQRLEELGRSLDTEDDDVLALMSGQTAAELGAGFALEDLGAHELRGTGAVFDVVRLVAAAGTDGRDGMFTEPTEAGRT